MFHNPLPPSTTRNHLLYSQARMVLYYIFCIFAWSFCIKLEPHQLTVILGLMSTTVFSGNLLPGKPVVTTWTGGTSSHTVAGAFGSKGRAHSGPRAATV